jgi:hypothetical protein
MSMLFNAAFYLKENPDVLLAVAQGKIASAEAHFNEFGAAEGRDPNATFDTTAYFINNPDVLASGMNPLTHFLKFGAAEGRSPSPSFVTSALFDTVAYAAANPDLAKAGITTSAALFEHFAKFGFSEVRTGVQTTNGVAITNGVADGAVGTTFTLTTGTDAGAPFTGTAGNNTFDASGFFNGGTGTTIQTLSNSDSLDGGKGEDTLNVLLNQAAAGTISPAKLANIEVINLTGTGANAKVLDLANATGVTTLNSVNTDTNVAQFNNVQSAPTNFGITNSAVGLTANVVNTALAGTADAATVTLQSVTAGTVTLQTVTAASGYETVNLVSNGATANTLTALTDGNGTSLATVNISGSAALTLGTLDATVLTVDGSKATGILNLDVNDNTVKSNIKTGTANDVINIAGRFVDGTTAATVDVIDGGAGIDKLILNAAEAGAVGSAAEFSNVKNIETVAIADDATGVNFNTIFLGGISTLEFDGLVGAHTVTAASGNTIRFDAADVGDDNRGYVIAGTGTTDALTFDINGVDIGGGTQTLTGVETATFAVSGTSVLDGTITMTATAATETLVVTGSGTFVTGNITANVVNASAYTGAFTTGTLQQATNFSGGTGVDTVVGSTAADIITGGAGADFITNTVAGGRASAGDVLTGGDGFDTFTLVGDSLSTTNYSGSSTITDFTVGTSAANTDLIRFSANDASYNDDAGTAAGLSDAAADGGAAGAVVVQGVAQGVGTAAVASVNVNFLKLTTGVAFNTDLQTTFNNALGNSIITGLTADSVYAGSYYDITNTEMVIFAVDVNATDVDGLESGDEVQLIGTIDMTAANYALIDADNFAAFI